MPTLDEVHQGIGSGELTTDFDRELLAEAQDYRHVVIYRDGKLKGSFVLLARSPSLEGITLSGFGVNYWLGLPNKDGPVIRRREYIAGNDQLSNGSFELLDALGFPLRWSRTDGSGWALGATPHTGTQAMQMTAVPAQDDVLVSTEPRALRAGALVEALCWVRRSGSFGFLRLRTVYEGRFDPPDLLEALDFDVDWTNDSEFPADVVMVDSDSAILGPCTQPQIVTNPSFEDGLTGWVVTSGAGWAVVAGGTDGADALSCIDLSGGTDAIINDYDPDVVGTQVLPVKKGHRFRLEAAGWAALGTTGNCDVRIFVPQPVSLVAGDGAHFGGDWQYKTEEVDANDDGVVVTSVNVWAMSAGQFKFDNIRVTRIKGNTAKLTAPAVEVTPEKAYKLSAKVTGSWPASGPTRNGTLHYSILLRGTGRDNQVIASSELDVSQAATEMLLEHTFTPPSGYDSVTVTIVGTDLDGGSVTVERPSLRCQDTSISVVDRVIGPAVGTTYTEFGSDSVAPAGTEKVHVELVAEQGAGGWEVDDVSWHRREATTTKAQVIDDLLRHPDTGNYLVNPGTISAPGLPSWDWYLDLTNNGEAMREFLAGGRCDPPLEWRHDPDNTFHVGTADQIYSDSGLLFVDQDLLLLSRGEVQSNVADQVSRVIAIGAALQRKAPLPDAVIVGLAEAAIPGAYDWNDNPVLRTRVIEDQGLDYQGFADARSADELEASALRTQSVNVEIAAWHAWGDFVCGDWTNSYKPEALLEDRSNPMAYKGRRVYPKKLRALSRRLEMAKGDGWEVGIRRPDASIYWINPKLIRWAERTRATVELGEKRIDFANDPQGPAAGLQFLRHRALQANS